MQLQPFDSLRSCILLQRQPRGNLNKLLPTLGYDEASSFAKVALTATYVTVDEATRNNVTVDFMPPVHGSSLLSASCNSFLLLSVGKHCYSRVPQNTTQSPRPLRGRIQAFRSRAQHTNH